MLLDELFEKVSPAYLYHGTSLANAVRIIEGNRLNGSTMHTRGNLAIHGINSNGGQGSRSEFVSGVSMTRQLAFAEHWGEDVVFVFDQMKLRQRYRIAPVDFMSDRTAAEPHRRREEFEEFVIAPEGITNLDRYLVQINMDYFTYDEIQSHPSNRYCEALMDHPLLNVKY